MKKKMSLKMLLLTGLLAFGLSGCFGIDTSAKKDVVHQVSSLKAPVFELSTIPEYSGTPYAVVNNNNPYFTDDDLTTRSFESYSELDSNGRCGVASASVGKDIMPTKKRGRIGSVKPSGWHTAKYNGIVDGNYLYNRCHLIGYQLTGENANKKNLITGTRYLNVDGMLPFEDMVADYVKETNNHVLYRVTPIFEGDNLVASGVLMEAKSVEDDGEGVLFNVYCYNVQPQIVINYADGNSYLAENTAKEPKKVEESVSVQEQPSVQETPAAVEQPVQPQGDMVWIPNSGTKYHRNAGCSNMKNPSEVTRDRAESLGYAPCKKCY